MTPAAGPARLTERDLAAIETFLRHNPYGVVSPPETLSLVAEVRAAWSERDELRAALRRINTATVGGDRPLATLWTVRRMIDAALAAPGAGEGGEA